jgi:hypothetical protein
VAHASFAPGKARGIPLVHAMRARLYKKMI